MIFPRALGYIDEAVTDLFDRLDKRLTPGSLYLGFEELLAMCRYWY
ncbi:hypothetical protein Gotur_031219 [Gossypium turneri]